MLSDETSVTSASELKEVCETNACLKCQSNSNDFKKSIHFIFFSICAIYIPGCINISVMNPFTYTCRGVSKFLL